MEDYKKKYYDLLAQLDLYKAESIKWSTADFTEYDHPTHTITEEQAQEALEAMIDNHDANYGITWNTVEYYITQMGTEK